MSGGKTKEKAVTIVKSGSDEGMCEYFSCGVGAWGMEACKVTEVKEGCFSDVINVWLVGEGGVHYSAQIAYRGGGGHMMTVDEEGKALHSGEERFGSDDEDFCFVAVEKRSHPGLW